MNLHLSLARLQQNGARHRCNLVHNETCQIYATVVSRTIFDMLRDHKSVRVKMKVPLHDQVGVKRSENY